MAVYEIEASQNQKGSSKEKAWHKKLGRNNDCVEGVRAFAAHSSGRRLDDKEVHN